MYINKLPPLRRVYYYAWLAFNLNRNPGHNAALLRVSDATCFQ